MTRQELIENYIQAYNDFDIDKMIANLDEHILFENISNGVSNMMVTGKPAFRKQAEEATQFFTTRQQVITSWKHENDITEIEITYKAVLATDLPNGLKKGDNITLHGKSIFTFSGKKIIALTDVS